MKVRNEFDLANLTGSKVQRFKGSKGVQTFNYCSSGFTQASLNPEGNLNFIEHWNY
jgi:hypothetical protein